MAMDMPALATNTVTSLSSVGVLAYALGTDPLGMVGSQVAIMIATVVALCGVYDLGEQFDLFE